MVKTNEKTNSVVRRENQIEYDIIPTPAYAVNPLVKWMTKQLSSKYEFYVKPIIWECAGTLGVKSEIAREFERNGFDVVETSKSTVDFLKDKANFPFDVIVTNPPYSIKDDFLRRCITLKKPFAMLLPVDAVSGVNRHEIYQEYMNKVGSISILALDNRIDFTNNKNPHTYSVWVLGNLTDTNEYIMSKIHKVDRNATNGLEM